MKYLIITIAALFWISCSGSTGRSSSGVEKDTIPPDGVYRFDIAFAEWDGKSMGEKVTVVIKGDSINVSYEGDGELTLLRKGDVLSRGILMKHRSGVWIIGRQRSDMHVDEVGGCSDGPPVISFKERKYWMC